MQSLRARESQSALMDTPPQQNLNQLAIGTVLGDFKITGIVGEGGFGIVYLAYEATLDRTVAIKEYLPSAIAGRTGNQSVMVRSQLNSNAFTTGLKNFLREAQLLARFSHPAMVEVHRVWEQNSTAYMAMRYYDGKTLRELRQADGKFDELYIKRLVEPILDALTLLHAQNVIHRDVSPDNILMRGNGAPVLLDLGAARLVVGGMTQALTTILKPGYAPIEQYVDDGTMRQGPWTDVYGLGAVLYYLLTGAAPPQAVARMITDPLRNTLTSNAKIPVAPYFLGALAKALAVRPEDRYQTVDELRDGLRWDQPLPVEPRTSYARTEASKLANTAGLSIAGTEAAKMTTTPSSAAAVIKSKTPTAPTTPTAPILPAVRTAPVQSAASISLPLDRALAHDSEATVTWQPSSVAEHPITGAHTKPSPTTSPAPPTASRPVPPVIQPAPAAAPRAKAYVEASPSGSKMWLFAALAAVLASGTGYFALNRGDKTPLAMPSVVATNSAPPVIVAPVVPATVAVEPPTLPTTAVTTPAVTVPPKAAVAAVATVDPAEVAAKTAVDAKARAAARVEQDALAAARAEKAEKSKRDAEDRAKAKVEMQERSAKAKLDAEERAKARAKLEADERAAAASRADLEERARKARTEDEERQAAAKVRADADRQAKANPYNTGGLVVTPPRRTVEELSTAGKAAFGRGEIAAARAAWNELLNHPDAQARSKAITYNNLAVSYCKFGDEASCERMYLAMFRADRNYDAEERENPQFKKAYERAARTAKALR